MHLRQASPHTKGRNRPLAVRKEEEPSCIFLRIDLQEFIGEVRQEELRADEILELGVVIHEHPSQRFATAPPVNVCRCNGLAVAEILPYLFEAGIFVHYFLALRARSVITDHVLLRSKLLIEVQISRWVEGL